MRTDSVKVKTWCLLLKETCLILRIAGQVGPYEGEGQELVKQ